MIRSEKILPIRFYDDMSDQNRFNTFCDPICENQLIYPADKLPTFQIKRPSDVLTPTSFWIRNICTDALNGFYKLLDESVSNIEPQAFSAKFPALTQGFETNPGGVPITLTVTELLECGRLKNTDIDSSLYTFSDYNSSSFIIPASPCMTRVKITVEKFQNNSGGFNIQVADFMGVQGAIQSAGAFTFDFVPNGNIEIRLGGYDVTDVFEISYIQAEVIDVLCLASASSGVQLDETKLSVIQLNDGNDIIIYCENSQPQIVEPGQYYYIVKCLDSKSGAVSFFFSEVFSVKTVKELENLYRINWYNNCDLNDVIYDSGKTLCVFYNTIYLNAGLFKPNYTTSDDGEEDGSGEFNSLIKKWQKILTLEVPGCPQFLSDSLSALFIHEYVNILEPIQKNQLRQNYDFLIKRVLNTTVTDIFDGCQQTVNLELLIGENVIKTGCCDNTGLFSGSFFKYNSGSDCLGGTGYFLQITDPPNATDGLINCQNSELVNVAATDIIKKDDKYYTLKKNIDNFYVIDRTMPKITGVNTVTDAITGQNNYIISAEVIPYTSALLQKSYNGGAWTTTNKVITSDAEGDVIFRLPTSNSIDATDFDVRVLMFTIDQDISYSDPFDIV